MVTKARKEETVQELKDKFGKAKSIYTTKQFGLTVEEITNLRNEIRDLDAEFKIAKNTLFKIAAKGSDFEGLTDDLSGTTAFVFCYEDQVGPIGKVKKFSKDHEDKVVIEAGVLDGEVLDQEKVNKIAGLPSKDTLLSQIAGMLVQPTSQIAYIAGELGNKDDKDKLVKDFIVAADSTVDEASNSGDEAEEEKAEEEKAEEG